MFVCTQIQLDDLSLRNLWKEKHTQLKSLIVILHFLRASRESRNKNKKWQKKLLSVRPSRCNCKLADHISLLEIFANFFHLLASLLSDMKVSLFCVIYIILWYIKSWQNLLICMNFKISKCSRIVTQGFGHRYTNYTPRSDIFFSGSPTLLFVLFVSLFVCKSRDSA